MGFIYTSETGIRPNRRRRECNNYIRDESRLGGGGHLLTLAGSKLVGKIVGKVFLSNALLVLTIDSKNNLQASPGYVCWGRFLDSLWFPEHIAS